MFRTRHQLVIGAAGAFVTAGVGVLVLLLPTDGRHGRFVIAATAFLAAAGMARFASCRVRVTPTHIHVTNMLSSTVLPWEKIREFQTSKVGACVMCLDDGTCVFMTGIQQTNLAAMSNRQDTPQRRMIDELNELLRQRHRSGAETAAGAYAARSRGGEHR